MTNISFSSFNSSICSLVNSFLENKNNFHLSTRIKSILKLYDLTDLSGSKFVGFISVLFEKFNYFVFKFYQFFKLINWLLLWCFRDMWWFLDSLKRNLKNNTKMSKIAWNFFYIIDLNYRFFGRRIFAILSILTISLIAEEQTCRSKSDWLTISHCVHHLIHLLAASQCRQFVRIFCICSL